MGYGHSITWKDMGYGHSITWKDMGYGHSITSIKITTTPSQSLTCMLLAEPKH
jgi:hypothetical protein